MDFDPAEEERVHDLQVAANGGRVVKFDPSDDGAALESWARVDLESALAGELTRPEPTVCVRDDGRGLFYPASVNGEHAESGSGKTMLAAYAAAQELCAGRGVLWVDLESDETVIIERLMLHGATREQIRSGLDYRRPADPFSREAVDLVVAAAVGCSLVIIDSIGEAFSLDGIDEDRDAQVGPWLRRVARRVADAGPAVLLIDHSTKDPKHPLHASGSKRKRASITGASYLVEAARPLTRQSGGRLRITVAKDRHGNYAMGQVVANYDMQIRPDGTASIKLYAPAPGERDRTAADLLVIAHKATQAVKAAGAPMTGRDLLAAMAVSASTDKKRAGIAHALGLGTLRGEPGPRGSTIHHYVHDVDFGTTE